MDNAFHATYYVNLVMEIILVCAHHTNNSPTYLFNQMCIIDPFPSSQVIRSYYALPSSSNILMNVGGLTCEDLMYSGTNFTIKFG